MLRDQGNLPEADPGNAGWHRDVALSHGRAATVLAQQPGGGETALDEFRQGRAIIAKLKAAAPDKANLPKDLDWFDAQIAKLVSP